MSTNLQFIKSVSGATVTLTKSAKARLNAERFF